MIENGKTMHVYVPDQYMDSWVGWSVVNIRGFGKNPYPGPKKAQLATEDELLAAYRLARFAGMENEGVTMRVVKLPSNREYDGDLVYGFKQSNNGTTFIVSPHRLPWLEPEWAFKRGPYASLER